MWKKELSEAQKRARIKTYCGVLVYKSDGTPVIMTKEL